MADGGVVSGGLLSFGFGGGLLHALTFGMRNADVRSTTTTPNHTALRTRRYRENPLTAEIRAHDPDDVFICVGHVFLGPPGPWSGLDVPDRAPSSASTRQGATLSEYRG